ncbi:MAG: cyclic nucleotide-binding domain-containing protein [Acidobacteriota bacterium]
MSTETDLIRKIDFFEPLDAKIISKIAEVCIAREYAAGDHIVKQGESGLGLFFITRGRVKVEIDRNGTRAVVAELHAEDFLGELSIIDNKPRSANVICLEDTGCLLLTRDSFSKLMNKYPEIAIQMAKALAGRIRATNEKMGQPVSSSVTAEATATGVPPPPVAAATIVPAGVSAPNTPPPAALATSDGSTKAKVRDSLVETFSMLYTLKAVTRFSAAVVGCPVLVHAGEDTLQETIGEVKIALFDAASDQVVELEAWDDGPYSVTVFRPESGGAKAFVSHQLDGFIARGERRRLLISTATEVPPAFADNLVGQVTG